MKRWEIIAYKHGKYKFPHELPNNIRRRKLGNYEILRKGLNFIEWQRCAHPTAKKQFC